MPPASARRPARGASIRAFRSWCSKKARSFPTARAGCRISWRAGSTTPEQLIVYTPEYFRKERNIDVRTGARVVSDRASTPRSPLETGESIRYERLVIATGARCDTSESPAPRSRTSSRLHTLDDAERMRRFLREQRPKTAAVDRRRVHRCGGGGRAAPPRSPGHACTSAPRTPSCATIRRSPTAVRKQLELHGVELHLGAAVQVRRRSRARTWS